MTKKRIAILISGRGSNMLALAQAMKEGKINGEVCTVLSNKGDAQGIVTAKELGLPARALDKKSFPSRQDYEKELMKELQASQPDLVVLAGFLHILGEEIISRYYGKMINIHPSLLPKYPGLHTHDKVIEAKEKFHGLSIHYTNNDLDAGPMILQKAIEILPHDSADSLAERLLPFEHSCLVKVISWAASDRLQLTAEDRVQLDDKVIPADGIKLTTKEDTSDL